VTSNLRVILALVALNSLPAAMLLMKVARRDGQAPVSAASADDGKGLPGPIVPLEPLMVPLSPGLNDNDDEPDHSVQIELELELVAEKDRSAVVGGISRVRDTIISYLADCTAKDMRGPEQIGQLKTALVSRMNKTLRADHVAGIYVKNLLVN
jgi:flagellar basal body-associated protein FliL